MKARTTLICAFALMLAAGSAMAGPNDVGALLVGSGGSITMVEGAGEISAVVNLDFLGKGVQSGYVILRESKGPSGPATWSDLVIFTADDHAPTDTKGDVANRVVLISDIAGGGITQAQLDQLPGLGLPAITLAGITGATQMKKVFETSNNPYTSWKPTGMVYSFYSDPSYAAAPGVSPVAMLILFALLAITGMLVIHRKRRTQSMLT